MATVVETEIRGAIQSAAVDLSSTASLLSNLHHGQVFDIGGSIFSTKLKEMTKSQFLPLEKQHERYLPTELFYNREGLQKWGEITRLAEYGQTEDEIQLLLHHGQDVAQKIVPRSALVDMGSGDVRKIIPLLEHLEMMSKPVAYFALDLSQEMLEESLKILSSKFQMVRCFGLWGTFEDGMRWLGNIHAPRCILSLGSMFGNDEFGLAVSRLRPWSRLLHRGDSLLIGLDARSDEKELWAYYHDARGLWESFIRNGLEYSNEILGATWYRDADWVVSGVIEKHPVMHRFLIKAARDVECPELDLRFKAGEVVSFFEAWKYGPSVMRKQFAEADLSEIAIWKSPKAPFYEYLVTSARTDNI